MPKSDPHDPDLRTERLDGLPASSDPLAQTRDIGSASPPSEDAQADETDDTFAGLQPGQMLGQYKIVERLGAGGMGHVYKAVHQAMDRLVALKVIAPHLVKDNNARKR